MRILVDTNVLFSSLLFPESKPAKALHDVADHHRIVLCENNITELRDIVERKIPRLLPAVENLLNDLPYELIPAVRRGEQKMRDPKDEPILNAAISQHVDVILTGDKDFLSLNLEYPKCMAVAQFLENERKETGR